MIFVTGATGRVGRQLVESLLKTGQRVKVLVRYPQKVEEFCHLRCAVVIGDLNQPDAWKWALQGCDRLMSIPPNTRHQAAQEIRLFQAAKNAGVQHIVKLSSIKASLDSTCYFFRQHAIAEQFLKQLGVSFTILQSNSFMQNFFWFKHEMAIQGTLSLPLSDSLIAPVAINDVVNVAHAVLTRMAHETTVYNITGSERLLLKEVAEIFSVITGKAVAYVNVSANAFKHRLVQVGAEEWYAEAIACAWQIASAEQPTITNVVSQLTGKQPVTFEQFMVQNRALFS